MTILEREGATKGGSGRGASRKISTARVIPLSLGREEPFFTLKPWPIFGKDPKFPKNAKKAFDP
jgi:hypothetical protein